MSIPRAIGPGSPTAFANAKASARVAVDPGLPAGAYPRAALPGVPGTERRFIGVDPLSAPPPLLWGVPQPTFVFAGGGWRDGSMPFIARNAKHKLPSRAMSTKIWQPVNLPLPQDAGGPTPLILAAASSADALTNASHARRMLEQFATPVHVPGSISEIAQHKIQEETIKYRQQLMQSKPNDPKAAEATLPLTARVSIAGRIVNEAIRKVETEMTFALKSALRRQIASNPTLNISGGSGYLEQANVHDPVLRSPSNVQFHLALGIALAARSELGENARAQSFDQGSYY